MSQVTGSLISAVKDACRSGLLDWSPRLMLAMYSCEIQASSGLRALSLYLNSTDFLQADVLGKVYGVVAKRRGRIIAEEMKEGTSFFNVSALLPVVESFGFADGRHQSNIYDTSFNTPFFNHRHKDPNLRCCQPAVDFQRVSKIIRKFTVM